MSGGRNYSVGHHSYVLRTTINFLLTEHIFSESSCFSFDEKEFSETMKSAIIMHPSIHPSIDKNPNSKSVVAAALERRRNQEPDTGHLIIRPGYLTLLQNA